VFGAELGDGVDGEVVEVGLELSQAAGTEERLRNKRGYIDQFLNICNVI
jgi:hypothetical protein